MEAASCYYLYFYDSASISISMRLPQSLHPHERAAWFSGLLNERAARDVRGREVHLFTAVAPLQCIAGATCPRGFSESQRGAAGGPLARTPVRLKPSRQKSRSLVSRDHVHRDYGDLFWRPAYKTRKRAFAHAARKPLISRVLAGRPPFRWGAAI